MHTLNQRFLPYFSIMIQLSTLATQSGLRSSCWEIVPWCMVNHVWSVQYGQQILKLDLQRTLLTSACPKFLKFRFEFKVVFTLFFEVSTNLIQFVVFLKKVSMLWYCNIRIYFGSNTLFLGLIKYGIMYFKIGGKDYIFLHNYLITQWKVKFWIQALFSLIKK